MARKCCHQCFPSAVYVFYSDSYIVRVKAVVMTWDDSSGGWLAQDGCLSRVGVCRLLPPELLGRNTFLIHGERLKDRQVSERRLVVTSLRPYIFQIPICLKSSIVNMLVNQAKRVFENTQSKTQEEEEAAESWKVWLQPA